MTTKEAVKHTPGPWRVGPYYRHEVVSDHGTICYGPIETEEHRANARLIAACPTMHEYIQKKAEAGDAEAQSIIANI